MTVNSREEFFPPDFIEGIQESIEARKKILMVSQRRGERSIDWPKVYENMELLKKNYSDFSQMFKEGEFTETKIEIAQKAMEISKVWQETWAIMDERGK